MARRRVINDDIDKLFDHRTKVVMRNPANMDAVEKFNTSFEQFRKSRSNEQYQEDLNMFRPKLINKE